MARQERSAGFIIYHLPGGHRSLADAEYLVLDYGRHWDFAKGHVEPGEDDMAAALRELDEETGITSARVVPGFQHQIDYYFRHSKRGLIHKTVVFFLGEVTSRAVTLSHEHTEARFLPIDAAIDLVTFPTAKEVLRKAHDFLTASGL